MTSRHALQHDDLLPWLLERREPAVRALTRRTILDRGPRDEASKWVTAPAVAVPKHAFPEIAA